MGSANCKEYTVNRVSKSQKMDNSNDAHQDSESEYVEKVVCKVHEIENNEMKQFDLGDNQNVLLIRQSNELHAIGAKCTHYGAPLHTGALGRGYVRCPWHGACFNIKTGDIEDFPGLDSLPCYEVKVEDAKVIVRAKKSSLKKGKRIKAMAKFDPSNGQTFVIIGGGPAGGVCAETLRQQGFTGKIVLISKENALPYDRIKLTKAMNVEMKTLEYRCPDFYKQHSIDTLLATEVIKIDTCEKSVMCSDLTTVKYDKILIATGSRAVKANIPGADLENVVTIRDHVDAHYINAMISPEIDVVCLGTSFIAMEAAAFLVGKVKSVTIIGRGAAPFELSFGPEIGQRVLKLFEEKGVKMIMKSGIKECIGNSGKLTSVRLADGIHLPCQILIMGTGTKFNTEFLKGSGINLNSDGSVEVDSLLMTNVEGIYAAGDLAYAPVFSSDNKKATIGHYQLAQYHGKIAATNMSSNTKPVKSCPFFWTMVFGKSFRYAGHGKPSKILIEGSLDDLQFIAYHLDDQERVIAVASCGRDPVVVQYAELRRQGKQLHKNDIVGDPLKWTTKILECPSPSK